MIHINRLLTAIGITFVYFLAGYFGLSLAFETTNVSPVWPPSGIALAALLLAGERMWPAIAVGAVLVNFVSFGIAGDTWLLHGSASMVIALGNTLEAVVAARLIRGSLDNTRSFHSVSGVFRYVLGVALSCAISALVGTATLVGFGFGSMDVAGEILATWWLGDCTGMLVVTPLVLVWCQRRQWRRMAWPVSHALALTVFFLLVSVLVFGGQLSGKPDERLLTFLFVPGLAYAAYVFGLRGVTLCVAAVSGLAIFVTIQGRGPFVFGSTNDSLLALDAFIVLWVCCGLVLAVDLLEYRRQTGERRREILLPWSVLLCALGVSILMWRVAMDTVQEKGTEQFDYLAQTIRARVADRMLDYQQVLRGGIGLFNASESVSRQEWHRFVSDLDLHENYPGIQGVGYARYLLGEDAKRAFTEAVRQDGFPKFEVKPVGERDIYVSIAYLEPFDWRNQRAHGYDMFSEALRRNAIEAARDSGQAALSAKITLVQETSVGVQAGFLMYLPLYRDGIVPVTVAQRRSHMRGVVYSPFRMDDLMEGILKDQFSQVSVSVFDGDSESAKDLLYQSDELPDSLPTLVEPFISSVPVNIIDRTWTVRVTSLPAFTNSLDLQKAQVILISGVVISFLLFSFVRALVYTRSRALALAKELTSALQRSEQKFSTLADHANEAIFIVDSEGRITSANPAAIESFRCSEQEMMDMSIEHLFADGGQGGVQEDFRSLLTGSIGTSRVEGRPSECVDGTGRHFPVEYSMSHWCIDDEDFVGVILRDVTEQRLAEERLRQASEAAEQANRAKSDFVANMSHEIRTPMNAVLGMTQILAKTSMSSDQRQYVEMIETAGQTLLEIINDILDFSKIEAGRLDIEAVPFSLDELVNSLATVMTIGAGNKSLQPIIGVAADVPGMLVGDELRIRQILLNLLSNAIKFTERGEVALLIEVTRREGNRVTLRCSVRDTGIGMTADQLDRLFHAFTQADTSMTRRFGGTGLGLAISRRLANLMSGTIEVTSEEGRGSCFTLTLPVTVQPGHEQAEFPETLKGLRVLLLDASATCRDYLVRTFEHSGLVLDAVGSEAEALERIHDNQEESGTGYDVLMIDQLPDTTEREQALARLRGSLANPDLLVLVLAPPHTHDPQLRQGVSALVSAVKVKPVTRQRVLKKLCELRSPQVQAASSTNDLARPQPRLLQGIRFLLVEDNELNQIVATEFLTDVGAEVTVAGNGQLAVDRLAEHPDAFDLVLMDVQMPVMDGLTATRAIRQELGLSLPVVAMSAGVLASERQRCQEAGMTDFVPKPVVRSELIETVVKHLEGIGWEAPSQPNVDDLPTTSLDQLNHLLRVTGGQPAAREAVLTIARNILERGQLPLDQAYRDWQADQPDQAAAALHSLRGLVGSLGETPVTALSQNLEQGIQDGHRDLDGLWHQIREAYDQLLIVLDQWLWQHDTQTAVDTPAEE